MQKTVTFQCIIGVVSKIKKVKKKATTSLTAAIQHSLGEKRKKEKEKRKKKHAEDGDFQCIIGIVTKMDTTSLTAAVQH